MSILNMKKTWSIWQLLTLQRIKKKVINEKLMTTLKGVLKKKIWGGKRINEHTKALEGDTTSWGTVVDSQVPKATLHAGTL